MEHHRGVGLLRAKLQGGDNFVLRGGYIYWRSIVAGRIQLVKLLSGRSSRLKLPARQRTRARGVVWFGRKQKDGYRVMGEKQFE